MGAEGRRGMGSKVGWSARARVVRRQGTGDDNGAWPDVHGGRGRAWRVRATKRRGRERRVNGGVLVLPNASGEAGGVRGKEDDARRHGGGAAHAWSPRRHLIEHVVGSEWGKVGCDLGCHLGQIRPRPKTKFAHLGLLYNFH
jgi:hypothetical protein